MAEKRAFRHLLPSRMNDEIAAEVADVVRRAVIEAGRKSEQTIVIGQINIQLNLAQGGGAKVDVRND